MEQQQISYGLGTLLEPNPHDSPSVQAYQDALCLRIL